MSLVPEWGSYCSHIIKSMAQPKAFWLVWFLHQISYRYATPSRLHDFEFSIWNKGHYLFYMIPEWNFVLEWEFLFRMKTRTHSGMTCTGMQCCFGITETNTEKYVEIYGDIMILLQKKVTPVSCVNWAPKLTLSPTVDLHAVQCMDCMLSKRHNH